MTTHIGELEMVSKHSLINGFPSTQDDKLSKPIIRDCGCVFRFTTTFRKNRLRTPVRVRKAVRNQSLNKIKHDKESVNNCVNRSQLVLEDSKNMCTEAIKEDSIKYTGFKRYTVKYFFDYKTVPASFKSTLTVPLNYEGISFTEEVHFMKQMYNKRVIETVTTTTNLPVYKATLNINCNSHYINLENHKSDQTDSEC